MSNSTSALQGWVDQPDNRGTFDIIWSSFFTIFLCTWTSLHLNIPAPNEGYWKPIFRKFRWMLLSIFGPEFVFAFAAGQRCNAKRVLKSLKRMGHHEWTLRHCFYANMGGLVLQPRDSVPFPIHGFHLLWLLEEKYLELPEIKAEEIKDKSKATSFNKGLVCLQTGWFVLQCFGRIGQKLPLTTLELVTISYVWCTWAIYAQWLRKPLDVEMPTALKIEASTEEILINAGSAASNPYRQTPLDFVWDGSQSWTLNVQPFFGFRPDLRKRPMQRILNDVLPWFTEASDTVTALVVILIYGAIHLTGWNLVFTTQTEKILWRAATLMIMCTVALFCFWELGWGIICAAHRLRINKQKVRPRSVYYVYTVQCEKIAGIPDLSIRDKKYEDTVARKAHMNFTIPIATMYVLSRLCIFAEALIALRCLPRGSFQNVNWATFIPHY